MIIPWVFGCWSLFLILSSFKILFLRYTWKGSIQNIVICSSPKKLSSRLAISAILWNNWLFFVFDDSLIFLFNFFFKEFTFVMFQEFIRNQTCLRFIKGISTEFSCCSIAIKRFFFLKFFILIEKTILLYPSYLFRRLGAY